MINNYDEKFNTPAQLIRLIINISQKDKFMFLQQYNKYTYKKKKFNSSINQTINILIIKLILTIQYIKKKFIKVSNINCICMYIYICIGWTTYIYEL